MGLSSPESTVSILHVMNGITGAAIKIPDGINAMLQPGGGVMDAINAYIEELGYTYLQATNALYNDFISKSPASADRMQKIN